jgi:hypothetical protein
MHLIGYDFKIYYQKGTVNSVNTPNKRPDYNKSNKL